MFCFRKSCINENSGKCYKSFVKYQKAEEHVQDIKTELKSILIQQVEDVWNDYNKSEGCVNHRITTTLNEMKLEDTFLRCHKRSHWSLVSESKGLEQNWLSTI